MEHPPTWFSLVYGLITHEHLGHVIQIFLTTVVIVILMVILARRLTRSITADTPSKNQNFAEFLYEAWENIVIDIVGPHGREYVPYVATLFFYILFLNLFGLIPGFLAPTSALTTTAALAITTFFYVQWKGIKALGIGHYLMHYVGEPKWLGPLNVPIHVIGELAKPLSLALRLFGNIYGKDTVLIIFLWFSVDLLMGLVPLQLPIVVLGILVSAIQALIFAMLTCIYLAMITAHHAEEEHH